MIEQEAALLEQIERIARRRRVVLYAVGGVIRDLLLGRRKSEPDFDFTLQSGSCAFGRYLSRRIRAAYVLLDEEHGACRLVKRLNGILTTFDFTDFRGPSITEDLRMRDFTVNALAVPLQELLKSGIRGSVIIDPLNGLGDLKKGVIRACGRHAFQGDPLRILRGFSFSALFGWKIARQTLQLMRASRRRLGLVSAERIRDELFKILGSGRAYDTIRQLDTLRILPVVVPEVDQMRRKRQGPYHHLDIWKHTLETVRHFEELVTQVRRRKRITGYLQECCAGSRSRMSLIKCACLLHDIGKPRTCRYESGKIRFHGHEHVGRAMTVAIGRRLKLSVDEIDSLARMVQAHLRPGYLAESRQVITARAAYRFFRDTKEEAPAVLLLSLADQRATRGKFATARSRRLHERLVNRLLKEYFRSKEEKKIPRLIDGTILMKRYKLTPSPLVGKVLAQVDELQAIGRIKTRQEALKAAGAVIRKIRQTGHETYLR